MTVTKALTGLAETALTATVSVTGYGGTATLNVTVPSAFKTFDVGGEGKTIAFGMTARDEDVTNGITIPENGLFECSMDADFKNGLTVGGHDSPIGTRLTSSLADIKVAAGIDTHHNGASLTLGKGTWIVIGRWNYNTRASGSTSSNRQVSIRVNGSNVNHQRINTYGVNYGMLQCFAVLELTGASTTVTCMGSCSLATNGTNYDSSNIWAVRIA